MSSLGRRLRAQFVERPHEVQGRKGAEGKAHSVVTESGWVRAPVQNDWRGRRFSWWGRWCQKTSNGNSWRDQGNLTKLWRNWRSSWTTWWLTTDQCRWIWGTSARMTRRWRRMTPTRARTCHTKTCAPLPGKDARLAREQARRDRMDQVHGIVGKELMNGRAARDDEGKKGGKKGSKGSKPDGTVTRTKGAREKSKGKGKGKCETRYC